MVTTTTITAPGPITRFRSHVVERQSAPQLTCTHPDHPSEPSTRAATTTPTLPGPQMHRIARIDASGRLMDARAWDVAGFSPDTRVSIAQEGTRLRITDGGDHPLDERRRLALRAGARTWRGWRAGADVLITAVPGVLVLRPVTEIDI